jgi:hypothetical protein
MEFQPEGKVRLTLKVGEHEETYTWNKITTCIHNLLGAERWVDLYGECVVSCPESGLTARLQFVKASYWSSKRHELFGTITDARQCCGSESGSGFTCFWASRIHQSEVWIRIRIQIWILLSPSTKSKKKLDSYSFVTF